MTYLLDVSTLLAWLWGNHVQHQRVVTWQEGQAIASCAITDLGFIRISSQKAFGATVAEARELLTDWRREKNPGILSCDLDLLKGTLAPKSTLTTDFYLADLAQKHGMQLATLDESIDHPAAYIIPLQ